MTLREKIEGLDRFHAIGPGEMKLTPLGRYLSRPDVLAAVEEWERERDERTQQMSARVERVTKRIDWGDGEVECIRVHVGGIQQEGGSANAREPVVQPAGHHVTPPPAGKAGGEEFRPGLPPEELMRCEERS